MNKELLTRVLNLLKNNLEKIRKQKQIIHITENVLEGKNPQDLFIGLSKDERNQMLITLGFQEEEIKKIEENVKILTEPLGTGGIWIEFFNKSRDYINVIIERLRENFVKVKEDYKNSLEKVNNIDNFIELVEKEEYYNILLEDAANYLSILEISDKEKYEILYFIFAERSKYHEKKSEKIVDIKEVESNIDLEIEDTLIQVDIDEPVLEPFEQPEDNLYMDMDEVEKTKNYPILDSLNLLNENEAELVVKSIEILKNSKIKDNVDYNTFNSYTVLASNYFKEENNMATALDRLYEENKLSVFKDDYSFELFIIYFMGKIIDDLYEAINLNAVSETDKKEKQDILEESLTLLKLLYEYYENNFKFEELEVETISEPIDDKKDIIIFGIEDPNCDYFEMENNLKNNFKNVLQKLHDNKGVLSCFKKDKNINFIIHNNVVVYLIKVNNTYLILNVLTTGEAKHTINTIFTLKNSKKVNDYIYRLLNEPEFYNKVLELSENFYGGPTPRM